MDHFYAVLSQSKIGRMSSFGEHITYLHSKMSLQHHDYADTPVPPNLKFITQPTFSFEPLSENTLNVLIFARTNFRAEPGFARNCAKISTEFFQFRAQK